ncbi:heme exporter protein CcmB [Caldimonas brevitalea]|uniref:Heme exporter protein B n=1 Tax=Caldimonas brevitalea TaxID=413882 RepID=A0A0G3BLT6_9BURK|nr:heme exporter protein CcmB [Caldimonas brevitalea]AKJ28316.1 heme exporter protein B [Caldimonas brevitalea]
MFGRGVRLAWRRRVDSAASLAFFLIVAALFPLALMSEARSGLAPAATWIAALLATTLGSLRLFTDDAANGVLDQLLLAPGGTGLAVGGLLCAHFVTVGAPLLGASPLVALFYDLSFEQWARLAVSLLLGLPALCVLSALGAALTLGARAGGLLLALLVVPWGVPVLLFGIGAAQGISNGAMLLLAAATLFALALGPWGVGAALRMNAE